MVLGVLLRYLANNEQLVQRMSESFVMRRAAQLCIAAFYRGKLVAEQRGLSNLTPARFRSVMAAFQTNLKKEIEGVKEELKKQK